MKQPRQSNRAISFSFGKAVACDWFSFGYSAVLGQFSPNQIRLSRHSGLHNSFKFNQYDRLGYFGIATYSHPTDFQVKRPPFRLHYSTVEQSRPGCGRTKWRSRYIQQPEALTPFCPQRANGGCRRWTIKDVLLFCVLFCVLFELAGRKTRSGTFCCNSS